jgi:hypothetical protein
VLTFVLVALFAPLIAPYEPGRAQWGIPVTPSSVPAVGRPPARPGRVRVGPVHQLVYGARQSLVIGVVSTVIGLAVGSAIGLLAGGIGGKVDVALMRLVDVLLSIPEPAARGEHRSGAGPHVDLRHDRHRCGAGARSSPGCCAGRCCSSAAPTTSSPPPRSGCGGGAWS